METLPPINPTTTQSVTASGTAKRKLHLPTTLPEFIAASGRSNARPFLRKLAKGAFSIPSRDDIRAMAGNLGARHDGALRLVFLLQALDETVGSIRESILLLTEDYLRERRAFPSLPTPPPPSECCAAIERLARPSAPKQPRPNFDLFGIFLLLAFHRDWLGEDDVVALLENAFPAPKPKRSRSGDIQVKEPAPIAAALGAPLKKPNVAPLLVMNRAWKKRTDSQAKQISSLEANIQRLEGEKSASTAELQRVQAQVAELNSKVQEKERRIDTLERELTDSRTVAQHRYDAVKGRARGFLEGELLRWLQNATEAASVEPPRVRVIQERLQSAINGIQKEAQWLQSLD